jgi:hypothetical protein
MYLVCPNYQDCSETSARLLEESSILSSGRVWLYADRIEECCGGKIEHNFEVIILWALSVFLRFEKNTAYRELGLLLS